VFACDRGEHVDLCIQGISGAGRDELLGSGLNRNPTDWSRDGRFLLYAEHGSKTGFELWVLQEPAGSPANRKSLLFATQPSVS
jgi:Tol biopolymer transport system component